MTNILLLKQQATVLDKFIDELEELLHSTPYSDVDIHPLVKKYTEGKSDDDINNFRRRISSIIHQLKEDKLIDTGLDYGFQLTVKNDGHYSEAPIMVTGKRKFEEEYRKKHTPLVQPITNNTINVDKNSGAIVQDSEFRDLDFRPAEKPQDQPKTVAKKTSIRTTINWIWDIITTHPLISGIIAAVIAGLILYKVFHIG